MFSSHGLFGWHTKFDQKHIWHKLLGVVYHVKKVSTIFDDNWSQNIILKKNVLFPWKWYENPQCIGLEAH